MADKMLTSCTRCGLTDELTLAESMAHDDACRRRKERRDNECPVHLMPDCSPLLNGCSRLTSSRT